MHRFSTEDQAALRDAARRFAELEILPRAAAIDRDDRFDRGLYRAMAGLGFFGVALPEADGGVGLGAIGACIAMEEFARCSGAVANAFAIPVEAALFLRQHGNARQQGLIAGILAGDVIPATAVTEPDHGSDVAGLRTTARRDETGRALGGTPARVTPGAMADALVLVASTLPGAGPQSPSGSLLEC